MDSYPESEQGWHQQEWKRGDDGGGNNTVG